MSLGIGLRGRNFRHSVAKTFTVQTRAISPLYRPVDTELSGIPAMRAS